MNSRSHLSRKKLRADILGALYQREGVTESQMRITEEYAAAYLEAHLAAAEYECIGCGGRHLETMCPVGREHEKICTEGAADE